MKLTKQQLKQIIKEELMIEMPIEQNSAVNHENSLKILQQRFEKLSDSKKLAIQAIKSFGKNSSRNNIPYDVAMRNCIRLIKKYYLSNLLEDEAIDAFSDGFYFQSARNNS